jgi:hypothetical protein
MFPPFFFIFLLSEKGKNCYFGIHEEKTETPKRPIFLTLKRGERINSVTCISANQIAIGLGNGEIEINEIVIYKRRLLSFLQTTNKQPIIFFVLL